MKYANGDEYEGEFQYGKPNGQGTMTYADGSTYVGEFQDGEPHGQGTMTYANGNTYVGEFQYGKPNGKGKMTYPKRQHPNWKQCEGTMENGTFKNDVTITYVTGEILHRNVPNGSFTR